MDANIYSKIYLCETVLMILSTSLSMAVLFRDRFTSRVWKYTVHERRLTDSLLKLVMKNIADSMRCTHANVLPIWIIIGFGMIGLMVFLGINFETGGRDPIIEMVAGGICV